jgi:hypothetical protein
MHRRLRSIITAKLIVALTLLSGTGVLAAQVGLPEAASPTAVGASATGIATANQAPTAPDAGAPAGLQLAEDHSADVASQLDDNAARLEATLADAIARLQENGANQAAIDAVTAVHDAVAAGDRGLGTAAAAVAGAPVGPSADHPSASNHPDSSNHPGRP